MIEPEPEPGLSPRGRGNLSGGVRTHLPAGSIPAWAGEPSRIIGSPIRVWVYPRVGGGTMGGAMGARLVKGLSPRGRGNQRETRLSCRRTGSIPAWAGEPSPGAAGFSASRVYPRVGGGTESLRCKAGRGKGLSPRGRGNLDDGARHFPQRGSIPAWAGEPRSGRATRIGCRVYPRVGGGTRPIAPYAQVMWGLSPRGRGKPSCNASFSPCRRGLSPRGRGNHQEVEPVVVAGGSIPAWAGEPVTR